MDNPKKANRNVETGSVSGGVLFVGDGSGDMIAILRRNLANRVRLESPPGAAAASIASQIARMRKARGHVALDEDEPHA